MRQRFNTNRLCSSENYAASKRVHIEDLKKNHESHSALFMAISSSQRAKTPLELFEEGVKRNIELFRKKYEDQSRL